MGVSRYEELCVGERTWCCAGMVVRVQGYKVKCSRRHMSKGRNRSSVQGGSICGCRIGSD